MNHLLIKWKGWIPTKRGVPNEKLWFIKNNYLFLVQSCFSPIWQWIWWWARISTKANYSSMSNAQKWYNDFVLFEFNKMGTTLKTTLRLEICDLIFIYFNISNTFCYWYFALLTDGAEFFKGLSVCIIIHGTLWLNELPPKEMDKEVNVSGMRWGVKRIKGGDIAGTLTSLVLNYWGDKLLVIFPLPLI